MSEREKALEIVYDALRGDGSMGTQAVTQFMFHLLARFGQEFTLRGAIEALDSLKESAEIMQVELNKAQP